MEILINLLLINWVTHGYLMMNHWKICGAFFDEVNYNYNVEAIKETVNPYNPESHMPESQMPESDDYTIDLMDITKFLV